MKITRRARKVTASQDVETWEPSELRSELYTKLIEVMQTSEIGHDIDEARQYTKVDVIFTEDNQLRIEVGAEVSYDDMWIIKEALDPIIQEVDENSYFDMEDSGLLSAYLDCSNCVESTSSIQSKSKISASNNYGGAYDLENEGFFTKDDLVAFDDAVIEILQECYSDTFRIDDSYIEDNIIYVSVQSSEGNWAEGSVKVDMRKIRKPSDILKYSNTMVGKLREELDTVYVESATAVEGTILPGPGDYNLPEEDEPTELDEIVDYINVYLDDDIILDADGSWEYKDETYQWACPDNNTRSWHCFEYSDVYLDDCSGVVEKVDDLIVDLLPDEPGTYHVSGNVNLYYSIIGIKEYRDYYRDEDGVSYDSTIVTDDADVYYVKEKSTLEDFNCVPASNTSSVDSATSIEGSNFIYDEHMTQDFRRVKYMIHYVGLDTSPSSDAQDLFNRFAAQVTEIHPYDDASYAWARIQNGVIEYFKDGRKIDSSFYMNADDYDIENSEWCQTVVDKAIYRLRDLNKDVEPRMIHN